MSLKLYYADGTGVDVVGVYSLKKGNLGQGGYKNGYSKKRGFEYSLGQRLDRRRDSKSTKGNLSRSKKV